MCPQSGDAAAGLSALVYGVPAPWQVTVEPSPGCQVTETGVAVAVTLSPGTVAVFDSGTHSAGLIHSQVGRFVSCKASWAGLERITGLGSPRVWRASAASTAGSGEPPALRRERGGCPDTPIAAPGRLLAAPRRAAVAAGARAQGRPDAAERLAGAVLAAAGHRGPRFPAAARQRAAYPAVGGPLHR